MDEERELALAIDRLSQKLGIAVQHDQDFSLVAASFAHDQILEWSQHAPTVDDLSESFSEWVEG